MGLAQPLAIQFWQFFGILLRVGSVVPKFVAEFGRQVQGDLL